MSRQELAKNQKHAGTCARTAELSGRGVPSRWQRSISLRISASIFSSGTSLSRCLAMIAPRLCFLPRSRNRLAGAAASVLCLGIIGGRFVFGHLVLLCLEAHHLARKLRQRAGAGELRALHG